MIYEWTLERNFFCQKLPWPADATTIRCVQNSWWIVDRLIIQQTKWSWNTAPIILGFSCAYISEYHINELRTPTTNTYNRRHEIAFRVCANRGLLIITATWMAFEKVGNTLRLTPQRCWIMTVNRRRLSRFLGWTVSENLFSFLSEVCWVEEGQDSSISSPWRFHSKDRCKLQWVSIAVTMKNKFVKG